MSVEKALLFGRELKHKVGPILAQEGVTFSNVLFITDHALERPFVKALSQYRAIQVKPVPEVHQDRLAATSSHLKAEGINDAHVFLKRETYKAKAFVSVISDLDMIVTNPEALAQRLMDFLPEGKTARERLKQAEQKGRQRANFVLLRSGEAR